MTNQPQLKSIFAVAVAAALGASAPAAFAQYGGDRPVANEPASQSAPTSPSTSDRSTMPPPTSRETAPGSATGVPPSSEQNQTQTREPAARDDTTQRGTQSDTSVGQKVDDVTLTARIKTALLADDQVKGLQINVDTNGGRVTLQGEVENKAQMEQAEKLARNINGVVEVDNQLRVKQGS
ncbi:MAG TPA: BON domain-containing protein [Burkholderiaceae bacterium]|nr:BON domain-containing protein [Burkholderiaceae bacterium]